MNPSRPTICHVLHTLHYGGAELLARRFAQESQSEFRPVFACLDDYGPLGEQMRQEGVPICVLDRRSGFDPRCVWRLGRWLRQERVELIQAHQYAPFFYSSLARWTARGIPVLFTEHGRDHPDYRRWKRVLANRILLGRSDQVVAVGEHVRQALIANEGLPPERVEVIYNGVDRGLFERPASEDAAVRAELGFAAEDSLIVQVARLHRLKDHATAIRAVARLRETRPNAHLLLIGDGEDRDSLTALVDSLGLHEAVHFLGTRSDVARLLRAAEIFLLTSVSEGIPLTLVEAMCARVPIVSTSVGGVPELITHNESGLLAEAGDVAGLANCMNRLLDDASLRDRFANAAYRVAIDKFDAQTMLSRYRKKYWLMVANASAPTDQKESGRQQAVSRMLVARSVARVRGD
jgi:glycosyltransferase involved in cell wall biosynthesis